MEATQNEQSSNESTYGGFKVLGQSYGDSIELPTNEEKPAEEVKTPESVDNSSLNTQTETKVDLPAETVTTSNETTEQKVTPEAVVEDEYEELDFNTMLKEIDAKVKEEYGFDSYKDVQEYLSVDYTNHDIDNGGIGEWDTVVQAMLLDDPGMTNEEVEGKMYKYNVLFDEAAYDNLSEAEQITLNAEFAAELRKAEQKLTEDQRSIDVDSLVLKYKKNTSETQQTNVVDKADAQKALSEILTKQMATTMEKVFSITDADGKEIASVKFTPNDADRTRAVENGKLGHERWMNQDGSLNEVKYAEEMFFLENRDRILAAVYGSAKAVGAEAQIKDINNIDFSENRNTPNDTGKARSLGQQLGWV
jgi:hypothetical protein